MEYDKQGDVEEDHADDVHADDVAMEVVEHGQNGVHQERDDEGSQADLGTYTLFVGLMTQKSNIAISSIRMNVAPVSNSHLKLTGHQAQWIIEFNRSKHLGDTALPPFSI